MKFHSILYNIKKSEIMATNINRDYLITLNVKSGAITAPSMYFLIQINQQIIYMFNQSVNVVFQKMQKVHSKDVQD